MPAPIQRHLSLQALSREHHDALLLCFKIRVGLKGGIDPERIGKYVSWFWQNQLITHFVFEEEFVFPVLGSENDLVIRALEEHVHLKQLFEQNSMNESNLKHLEQKLTQHIRFEERELFNLIQDKASSKQLKTIEKKSAHPVACQPWTDPFWSKPND